MFTRLLVALGVVTAITAVVRKGPRTLSFLGRIFGPGWVEETFDGVRTIETTKGRRIIDGAQIQEEYRNRIVMKNGTVYYLLRR